MKFVVSRARRRFYVWLCRAFYPRCEWLVTWNPLAIRGYVLWQRILNVNGARAIPWPVHFTSKVSGRISVGVMTAPGMSPGCYVSGGGGVIFGDSVYIGPGVKIISRNHDPDDLEAYLPTEPIRVGSRVWIGANVVILPGVQIGDGAVIGAGSVVTRDIPAMCVAAGNPARPIRQRSDTTGRREM